MAYFDKYGVEFSDDRKTLIKCPENFQGDYAVPDGVAYIKEKAFLGLEGLISITIPDSVLIIGDNAFAVCENLEKIEVNNKNPMYQSIDGVLFDKGASSLLQYPCGKIGKYTVLDCVSTIEDHAFEGSKGLLSISIGKNVKRIGVCAFHGCIFSTVIIPSNVIRIEEEAFSFCEKLISVVIEEGVQYIGKMAFLRCINLSFFTLPNSVKSIGENVFIECCNLKSPIYNARLFAFMPDSYVGEYSIPEGIEQVYALSSNELTSLIVPDSLTNVDFLSDMLSWKKLTSITLPNTITNIPVDSEIWWCLPPSIEEIRVPIGQKDRFSKMEGLKGWKDKIIEYVNEDHQAEIKPYYLFFDTETAGLPRNYKAPMQDTANWPRLVQLAWLLVDECGTELKRKSVIIRPDGFTIPEEAVRVHGITTERALNEGLPLRNVLDEFMQDVELAEEIVGHNIDFDIHIVGAELCRLGMSTQKISNKPTTCTMKSFTNFCAIPSNNGYGGYKWPTLDELYCKVFGRGMENAHDALADILATKECFFELKNLFKAKASSVPMSGKRTDLSDLPF